MCACPLRWMWAPHNNINTSTNQSEALVHLYVSGQSPWRILWQLWKCISISLPAGRITWWKLSSHSPWASVPSGDQGWQGYWGRPSLYMKILPVGSKGPVSSWIPLQLEAFPPVLVSRCTELALLSGQHEAVPLWLSHWAKPKRYLARSVLSWNLPLAKQIHAVFVKLLLTEHHWEKQCLASSCLKIPLMLQLILWRKAPWCTSLSLSPNMPCWSFARR